MKQASRALSKAVLLAWCVILGQDHSLPKTRNSYMISETSSNTARVDAKDSGKWLFLQNVLEDTLQKFKVSHRRRTQQLQLPPCLGNHRDLSVICL